MSEKKEYRAFEFKVSKAEGDNAVGIIEGYASTFGNVDLGLDVVDQGAFARTIDNKKGKFPILLDHDSWRPIGWNIEATEDSKGLKVKGEIQLITEEAKNRYALAKRALELDTKMGLSIGYSTIKSEPDMDNPNIRHLKELKLWEYSFVVFPMNEMAGVGGAKSAESRALFALLQSGRYDLSTIRKALESLSPDGGGTRPATEEADPEILHSVDRLIGMFRT